VGVKIEIGKTYAVRSVIGGHVVNNFQVRALGQDGWYYGLWMETNDSGAAAGRFSAEGLTDKCGYRLAPNIKKVKKYTAVLSPKTKGFKIQMAAMMFDTEQQVIEHWADSAFFKIIKIVEVEWEEEE